MYRRLFVCQYTTTFFIEIICLFSAQNYFIRHTEFNVVQINMVTPFFFNPVQIASKQETSYLDPWTVQRMAVRRVGSIKSKSTLCEHRIDLRLAHSLTLTQFSLSE